ncbi:MAG: ABC-three component system middle component 1 [Pleomorphochaeta sp.]
MNSVIKKLFQEYRYEIEDFDMGYVAFRSMKEYFIVSEYNEQEVQNFFECEKTNEIINQYMHQQISYSDFKKNCSLIICCNVQNIEEFKIKNMSSIFRIEEDEYYFRKYILIYTDEGLKNLRGIENIASKINEIVQDTDSLDQYQISINDNEEYFTAVQLMVKLPFLNFHLQDNKFVTIEKEIHNKLTEDGENPIYQNYLSFLNLVDDADEKIYFDELENALLSSDENNETLNKFIEAFLGEES